MAKPAVPPAPMRNSPPGPGGHSGWSDDTLLGAFLASGDQAAFAEIASRHGAMVFRTCLRRLGNIQDAEDAAQAVFLQLARRPARARGALGGWLHKVAGDTAVTLLRARARRARREEEAAMRKVQPGNDNTLREELERGIARLPARLREAVILCYLEGHKQEDAARILGCNQGTLSRWANDGLERLRALLGRRGVALTSVALVGFFAQQKAMAAVPAGLLGKLGMAAGSGLLSAQAAALADTAGKVAVLAKAKIAAAVVLTAAVVAAPLAAPAFMKKDPGHWQATATLVGHESGVFCIAFSPDGKLLASAGGDGTVRLWNLAAGQTRTVIPASGSTTEGIAWAPDGKSLAFGGSDGRLTLWDVAAGKARARVQLHQPKEGITFLAFAPDGKILVSAGWDQSVYLLDPVTGQQRGRLAGHQSGVAVVRFSPDGARLATASNDRTVRLWDAATGKQLLEMTGHTDVVQGLDFSPDGRFLASASRDKTVRLWDLSTGQRRTVMAQSVNRVAYAPDGKTLAVASNNKVVLWDTALAAECGTLLGHQAEIVALAFSPDGRTLASASYDRDVRLWTLAP